MYNMKRLRSENNISNHVHNIHWIITDYETVKDKTFRAQ